MRLFNTIVWDGARKGVFLGRTLGAMLGAPGPLRWRTGVSTVVNRRASLWYSRIAL